MATVYTKKCDICGVTALRRDSIFINPASSSRRYLVCKKCGKSLATFMKKKGLLKTMKPKSIGSQKERKLKTRKR